MKLIGKYFSLLVLSLVLLVLGCEIIEEGMPLSYAQKNNKAPSFNQLDKEAEEIALNDFRNHWSQIDVSSSSKEKTDWFAFCLENDKYPYGYCKYYQISVGGYEVTRGELSEFQRRNNIEWRGTVIIKIIAQREQNGLKMGEIPKPMKMDFQPSLSVAYNLIKEKGKWSFTYAQGSALLGPLFRTNLRSFRTPEQEAIRVKELLKTQQGERQKSSGEEVDVLKHMVYWAKAGRFNTEAGVRNATIAFFNKFTDKELACLNNTATAGIYQDAQLPLPFVPDSGFKGALWNEHKGGWDFGNMNKEEQAVFDEKWRSLSKFYKDEFFRSFDNFRDRVDPNTVHRTAPRIYPLPDVPMHTEASIKALRDDLRNTLSETGVEIVLKPAPLSPFDPNTIYSLKDSGITAPVITENAKPRYTTIARTNKIQGIVTLSVIFHKDGTLEVINVVKGLGYGLDEEAIKAAKLLKFWPAKKNGYPVSVKSNLDFSFNFL